MINPKKEQTKVIRGRETTCGGKLKRHNNTTPEHINPQVAIFKNVKIHQPKIMLQERIKNLEREIA